MGSLASFIIALPERARRFRSSCSRAPAPPVLDGLRALIAPLLARFRPFRGYRFFFLRVSSALISASQQPSPPGAQGSATKLNIPARPRAIQLLQEGLLDAWTTGELEVRASVRQSAHRPSFPLAPSQLLVSN